MLRHAHLTSTSVPSSNLFYLSVLISAHLIPALLDSGATLNFIHESIVPQLSLETTACTPTLVSLANGELLTRATRQTTLSYTIAGVKHRDTFLVAPIGSHSIILGMPWLERVNPPIDWRSKTIKELGLLKTTLPPPTVVPKRKSSKLFVTN